MRDLGLIVPTGYMASFPFFLVFFSLVLFEKRLCFESN